MDLRSYMRMAGLSAWHAIPNLLVSPLEFEDMFVFVCGCGHSGTTLVAAKLGNHPNVLMPARETRAFYPSNGLLSAKRVVQEWAHFSEMGDKKVVVEKTPKHVHSIGGIKKILPGAKFLVMTRNPLDNVASLYVRLGDLRASTERWVADNKAALTASGRDDVKVVRYEDLTGDPETEFRAIVKYAGLDWYGGILDEGGTAYDLVKQSGNMKLRAEQVRSSVRPNFGSWRKVLTEEEAAWVVKRTGALSMALGYDGSAS